MEPYKLATSGYRSQKFTMSFFKANTVSLIYPLPLVALFLLIAASVENFRAGQPVTGSEAIVQSAGRSGMSDLLIPFLIYALLLFGMVVLHELTHALFFLRSCENGWKSIKFGIKSLTPYFHCSEAVKVSVVRRSCLAPLWVLTLPLAVLSLITGNFVLYLLTIVMLFGSGADLWVALKLSKFNGKTCYALDMENEVGITVFVPDGNAVTADSNPGAPDANADTADARSSEADK
ncbi:MAG: DUF3267 domain-containing protein [Clostridiales bacterium]|nr:DUF3267 domain-containing protein [Clostridiales bacterium]